MSLENVDADLELCKKHLCETNSRGTKIESFLVRFLLVRICGEYEKEIKRIIHKRAAKNDDVEITSFTDSKLEAYKHLKIDDIRGNVLKKFSKSYLDNFDDMLCGNNIRNWYTSIIDNRNSSAHGNNIQVTFDELVMFHNTAKDLFPILEKALDV